MKNQCLHIAIMFHPLRFNENLQQSCQYFCDKRYEDSRPYVTSDCTFPESFIQEQIVLNQFSKSASVESLDTQTSHILELQERNNSTYDSSNIIT